MLVKVQDLINTRLRKEYPGDNDLPPQPCFSNRAVIEHFAQEAVAAYSGTPAVIWHGAYAIIIRCAFLLPD